MKRLYFITLLCITSLFISCENEELTLDELNQSNIISKADEDLNEQYFNDQMIVQYEEGLSEIEKQHLRDEYDVTSYKTCNCEDSTLELWYFVADQQGGGVNIEEKVRSAKGEEPDLEGADYNADLYQDGYKLGTLFGFENVNVALQKVVSVNNNVTIAILDTGVDYNYYKFTQPFLYNSSLNSDLCSNDDTLQDYFGWDFVNQDNDPYDDRGHGTIVTSFIYDKLRALNINFQILPIKIFNANGRGNYFDLLCGYKYAVNNPDVNIINMSFGWYNGDYELLNKFISESKEEVLITTSAGNHRIDTDSNAHFPSTLEVENILSIASLNNGSTNLARFSNFGSYSVDIAAKGSNIPFELSENEIIYVSGTSYSTAFTTAFAGEKYIPDMTVEQHIGDIILNTLSNDNLSLIKYSSFVPYY